HCHVISDSSRTFGPVNRVVGVWKCRHIAGPDHTEEVFVAELGEKTQARSFGKPGSNHGLFHAVAYEDHASVMLSDHLRGRPAEKIDAFAVLKMPAEQKDRILPASKL